LIKTWSVLMAVAARIATWGNDEGV
jgi:hypothetical protein